MLTHRVAGQLDAVRVVDEAIQDSIGERRIFHGLMPTFHRELAGSNGGADLVSVIQDFQQIILLRVGELFQPPIISNQHAKPRQRTQQLQEPALCSRQRNVFEHSLQPEIAHFLSTTKNTVSLFQWTWPPCYVRDFLHPTPRPRSFNATLLGQHHALAQVRVLFLDDSVRFAQCSVLQTQRVLYCATPTELHYCFAMSRLPNMRDQACSPTTYTLTNAYYDDTHKGGATLFPSPAE